MIPVFFPFTFLSESEAKGLAACFDRCAVWLPSDLRVPKSMQSLAERDLISLMNPFGKNDAPLEETFKHFEMWANLHGLGHLRQSAGKNPGSYYNDESSIYRLLDQIKTYPRPNGVAEKPDPRSARSEWMHHSRIFLQIAQEFDQRAQALQDEMGAVELIEHRFHHVLHATLDGIDGIPSTLPRAQYDVDRAYMLPERVAAWLCFLTEPAVPSTGPSVRFFVTTSQAIEDLLINAIPDIAPTRVLSKIPIENREGVDAQQWRNDLSRWLSELDKGNGSHKPITAPVPPAARAKMPTVSLTVYHVSLPTHQWFSRAAGTESLTKMIFRDVKCEQSTLLACVKNE